MIGFGEETRLDHVTAWRTQVVSGKNNEIVAATSAGELTLKVYEQPWTHTLQVTSATISHPVSDISMAIITTTLVDEDLEPLSLDGDSFYAAEEAARCVPTTLARCTREFRPMCGQNGVTYANPCLARAACQA